MTTPAPLTPDLTRLLALLRERGFTVGPPEALASARLLQRLAGLEPSRATPEGLGPKLRPLFCKSPAQQRDFDGVFAHWLAGNPPAPEIPRQTQPKTTVKPRRNYWLVVALAIWLAVSALGLSRDSLPVNTLPPVDISSPAIEFPPALPPPVAEEKKLPPYVWLLPAALLLWLGLGLPRRALSRARARREDCRTLDGWPWETEARHLVPALDRAAAERLGRPLGLRTNDDPRGWSRRPQIDIRRSVEATLRRLGVPSLCYRASRAKPSYWVLVEMDGAEEFAIRWAERLRGAGAEVNIHRFRRAAGPGQVPEVETLPVSPRNFSGAWPNGGRRPLDQWPDPPAGQRLLLLCDGACLADGAGQRRGWVRGARFERWPQRAVFTPVEPRDWGPCEDAIEHRETAADPGFLVLPLEESAQAAWAHWLVTGELPEIRLAEPQRFPRLIRRYGEALLEENPPLEPAEADRLVNQLKLYLGENGFYWLCACAVPPLLERRLTLLLGERFLRNSGADDKRLPYHVARYYRLLVRLPWVRRNFMPNWLRLALVARIPPRVLEEVRQAVGDLLARERDDGKGDLPLAFKAGEGEADLGYALFLGFMDGLTPQQLVLGMPKGWDKWVPGVSIGWVLINSTKISFSLYSPLLLFVWQLINRFLAYTKRLYKKILKKLVGFYEKYCHFKNVHEIGLWLSGNIDDEVQEFSEHDRVVSSTLGFTVIIPMMLSWFTISVILNYIVDSGVLVALIAAIFGLMIFLVDKSIMIILTNSVNIKQLLSVTVLRILFSILMSAIASHLIVSTIFSNSLDDKYLSSLKLKDVQKIEAAMNNNKLLADIFAKRNETNSKMASLVFDRAACEKIEVGENGQIIINNNREFAADFIRYLESDIAKAATCLESKAKGIQDECSYNQTEKELTYKELLLGLFKLAQHSDSSRIKIPDIAASAIKSNCGADAIKNFDKNIAEQRELKAFLARLDADEQRIKEPYEKQIRTINERHLPDLFTLTDILLEVVFDEKNYSIALVYLCFSTVLFLIDMSPVLLKLSYERQRYIEKTRIAK